MAQLPELERLAVQSRAVAPSPEAGSTATVMHSRPMLSLDKVYDVHLLADFGSAVRDKHGDAAPIFVCEPKVAILVSGHFLCGISYVFHL